jgi:tripartite-type tricarboxylate transporter receptor subunit TctC
MKHLPRMVTVVATFIGVAGASAQNFPTRPVTIVVPFAAGGPADAMARVIGDRMRLALGQQVIIENIAGAGGSVGVGRVVRAPPDGYTISIGHWSTHVVNGAIYELPYDLLKDLEPVAQLPSNPQWIVAKKSVPASNLKELIAWLKANESKVSAGTAGPGSASHVAGVYFQNITGTHFPFVPYRGTGPALNDLMAGQIDLMFELVTTAAPIIKAGNIRALGVTSRQRSEVLPEVATISELAIPGFDATGWFTVATSAGVPDAIVGTFNRDINEILRSSDLQDMWNSLALAIIGGSPEQASEFFGTEREKWAKVIATANIHIE